MTTNDNDIFSAAGQADEELTPFDVRDSSSRSGIIKLALGLGFLLALALILLKVYQPGVRDRDIPLSCPRRPISKLILRPHGLCLSLRPLSQSLRRPIHLVALRPLYQVILNPRPLSQRLSARVVVIMSFKSPPCGVRRRHKIFGIRQRLNSVMS